MPENNNVPMPPQIIGIKEEIDQEIAMMEPSEFPLVGELRDQQLLQQLETIVIKGTVAAYAVGEALAKIRDKELYKNRQYKGRTFNTFEEYCKNFFTISRIHAYRLIAYHFVRGIIGESADQKIPERLVRPLATIKDEEDLKGLWRKAKQGTRNKLPDYKKLAEVVSAYKKERRETRIQEKIAQNNEGRFFSKILNAYVNTEDLTEDVAAYIIEKSNHDILRLQALCAEFKTHISLSDSNKKELLATVKEWQKAVWDKFSSMVNG